MNQIQTMRVFVCVAELQSFRRAARKLGVSNALVTRSIAMLEAHLNTRLIHRTTRNLALTEAGTRYLDGCRALLEEFDHLEASVAHAVREPVGTLRVVISGSLCPVKVTPLVDSFRRQYPKVTVQLTIAEGPVDVLDAGYDVGIVTGSRLDGNPALIGHALAPNTLALCASPDYVTRHGEPHRPDDLSRHTFITLSADQHRTNWRLSDPEHFTHLVSLHPTYTVNSNWMVRAAALAGTGVALLPESFIAEALESGELVRILGEFRVDDPDTQLSIVYPNRQFLPARTRSFVEHALYHFGGQKLEANGHFAFMRESGAVERPEIVTGLQ
ncbi:LysR family transcriptional regulator [Burkholderia sp. FERM BP-3421]|jgi:DNA-binding transcriptional LysR family regulator|uniref:LysR family transcriptional regulator n=1 Tax=Burkholderia sp. FERM BP-3421 TaxID=1494466 RepID=UPI00236134D1|nr:LysR family transcriptional regulator [Burkholderia sp. FERM BP-3421]WDD96498.1 LysR family transcriptional regulator [Burkholderia sp. FERM BP-3421]